MTRQTLRAGPLVAEIMIEGGKLRSVDLPAILPEGLEAADLASLESQLSSIPPDFSDAPPFMRKVWAEMLKIPRGTAVTYGELAAAAGSPKAVRAVGQACATNRMPIAIPCHRVLSASGLGGFGLGRAWKQKLLELESIA